ncbi:MAG: hypothetical protein AMXMBFR64_19740 [Myxococcales bacterium]
MERKGWLVVGGFLVLTVVVFALGLRSSCGSRGATFADALVPGDAEMMVRVDVGPMRRLFMQPWLGDAFEEWPKGGLWGDPAVEAEVKELLLDRVGFHVHEVRRVTGFASMADEAVAAILDADLVGAPKGEGDTYEGVTIYEVGPVGYAVLDGKVIIGNDRGVRRVIDVHKGTAESVAKSSGLPAKRHGELLGAIGAAPLSFTADLSRVPAEAYAAVTLGEALEGVAVAVDSEGRWRFIVQGEPQALDSLNKKLEDLIATGLGLVESQKEALKRSGDTGEALMAILSNQAVKDLRSKLVLERSGRHLEARFDLEGATAAIPIIGVLAAVAVPSFIKYMERAKRSQYDVETRQREMERLMREAEGDDVDRAFPADRGEPAPTDP